MKGETPSHTTPPLPGPRTPLSAQTSAFRILVGFAAMIVIVAGLRAAKPVLVPLAMSAFLTVTSLPLLRWLQRRRVPSALAVPLVLLLIVALLVAVVSIATSSMLEIRDALPAYVDRFGTMWASMLAWMVDHRLLDPSAAAEDAVISPSRIVNLATGVLREAAGFMSLVILVTVITLFLLAETAGVPRKLRIAAGRPDVDLMRYTRVMREVQRYLAIKTVTSLSTGVLLGIWTLLIGMDFPLFWGLSAFLLNFIPTIGSLVAAVPAILWALLQLGPGGAILAAGGYLVVNTAIGNLIEPAVMGRRLGLSPLVVLISLLFWGWIWGPIGMLLSLPLTMVVKILIENSDELAWVAVLMGPAWDDRRAPREPVDAEAAPGD